MDFREPTGIDVAEGEYGDVLFRHHVNGGRRTEKEGAAVCDLSVAKLIFPTSHPRP